MMADSRRRFARRQRSRRLVVLRPVLIVGAVLALGLGAGWTLLYSHWLALQSVDVKGVHLVTNRQVERAAALPTGEALVRLDLSGATERIEQIPAVGGVTVSRSWPHSVIITVTERTPVAVVEVSGGVRAVDATGAEFKLKGTQHGLPKIAVDPTGGALDDAAEVVSSLPAEIARRVSEVRADTIDSITLALRGGDEVMWGSAADSSRKAEVLAVLLHHQATVYDVSVPDQPTITR
jgi:cell division protein FtsQ